MNPRTLLLLGLLAVISAYFCYDKLKLSDIASVQALIEDGDGKTSVVLLSDTQHIDRIFMSMEGPYGHHSGIALNEKDPEGLLWVTGLTAEVVGRDGKEKLSEEFFCHANLSLDPGSNSPKKHNSTFQTSLDWRLFTLVPGKMVIRLPPGFGIPMQAGEKLDMLSMSLNQNWENPNVYLRFKSKISYVRDADTKLPFKPLFMRGVYGVVPINAGAGSNGPGSQPKEVCAVGEMGTSPAPSPGMACAPPTMTASQGGIRGDMTLHWMVPAGRHSYTTDVTAQLKLDFDTTVHFATAHLHPMGESISLRDRTTGQTVLTFGSRDYSDKKGVAYMEEIASVEGVLLHQDHEYEIVTVYNNTTQEPTDVMGIVYLYLLDKNFGRKSLSPGRKQLSVQAAVGSAQG